MYRREGESSGFGGPRRSFAPVKVGEELVLPLEAHEDFGRIAAQTAKQVIIQKLREAERENIDHRNILPYDLLPLQPLHAVLDHCLRSAYFLS